MRADRGALAVLEGELAARDDEEELSGGAEVVVRDDAALAELLLYNVGPDSDAVKGAACADYAGGLEVVKRELAEGPEVAIGKNFEAFDRKFRIQQRELAEEVRRVVHHEGDRIVEAVNAGAHHRILDPEIHAIWKEMVSCYSSSVKEQRLHALDEQRWPGHVKSRHFVLDAYH